MSVPSGTVTFLFTDIEGSTRLWQADETAMRSALTRHDELLRHAVAAHDGIVFSSMGDGIAAAFSTASAAMAAALAAQRMMGAEAWPTVSPIRVRMGLHTGEAELRDGDYFGTAVNRAARLMAVGHGGQVLCSSQTAGLVNGVELVDLGSHRLRDLSEPIRVFQAGAGRFPPVRSLDSIPGNLPEQTTSFVGRDAEVLELVSLVGAQRLVTLTGVGGVGKTRLALHVAAELVNEFPDGVWLVELGPVGDPAAVADAVATALSVTPEAGLGTADSVARALSSRRMLVVVDNCEHVLDAAADLVETILANTRSVKVMATSRAGLRVGAEQLWPVPSLPVSEASGSAAVELFAQRAQAVARGFSLDDPDELAAVVEICARLDGIALAIELAAARMVSMTAQDIRDRLDDRFRLLLGARRGVERHQTLRQAVGWSYDLLGNEERRVLNHAAVFSGGFDLTALAAVCSSSDEYFLLDVADSLVRHSLVTIDTTGRHARYGLLETIRQFAEEQLAAGGAINDVRERHARYFADQAVSYHRIWDGPRQRVALDWVDVELANLRTGFRWAAQQGDIATAATIAAHTAMIGLPLQRFEPVGWAEEILEAAASADLKQLPRLYTAASLCLFAGRPEDGLGYAQRGVSLENDRGYDAFDAGWTSQFEAGGHLYAGRLDQSLDIYNSLASRGGRIRLYGLVGLLAGLPAAGRSEDAIAIAEETLTTARSHGSPFLIAYAFLGYGRAFIQADPVRALNAFREGLAYAHEQRILIVEGYLAQDAAGLEAVHGEVDKALSLFDTTIDTFHRNGNTAGLNEMLACLALFFERIDRPEIAATLCGACANHPSFHSVYIPRIVDHLRGVLGETAFDEFSATGAAMEAADAVGYARYQIRKASDQTADR